VRGESDKLLALTEERVLHRYRRTIERRARLLIEFAPAHVEVEDLVQVGSLGLLRAFRRARTSRGGREGVGRYLRTCIWGSLVDELRRAGGVGREAVRDLLARSRASEAGFSAEPASWPASSAPHASSDRVSNNDRNGLKAGRSVNNLRDEHDLAVTAEVDELWRLTERAIARLPRAERLVLSLYYLGGATMDEVARTLHFTQSRASQVHHNALERLRLRMRRFAP